MAAFAPEDRPLLDELVDELFADDVEDAADAVDDETVELVTAGVTLLLVDEAVAVAFSWQYSWKTADALKASAVDPGQ